MEKYILTVVNAGHLFQDCKTESFGGSESDCKQLMDQFVQNAIEDGYNITNHGYWFTFMYNPTYKRVCFLEITPLRNTIIYLD